jgi:hypothetical protein
MIQDNKGQMIMINMLFLFMAIATVIALIPALNTILQMAQQSDGLNCPGYYYQGNPNHSLSYNSSLQSSTLACLAINLYLPYIVLAVLIGGVSRLLLGGGTPAAV